MRPFSASLFHWLLFAAAAAAQPSIERVSSAKELSQALKHGITFIYIEQHITIKDEDELPFKINGRVSITVRPCQKLLPGTSRLWPTSFSLKFAFRRAKLYNAVTHRTFLDLSSTGIMLLFWAQET